MECAASFQHVSHTFNKFKIDDVTFFLPKGYLTVLLGRNGSGKSTLMNLLLNQYPDYQGTIQVLGKELRANETVIKDQIGYISETNPFFLSETAMTNARLYAPFYTDFDLNLFSKKLKELDVPVRTPLSGLSKGTFIKFQLAFAMAHHPKLYLMDEPTAGLDPVYRRDFLTTLSSLLEDGDTSILLSSHITEDFDSLADFVMLMDHGRLTFLKDRESLTDDWRRDSGATQSWHLSQLI